MVGQSNAPLSAFHVVCEMVGSNCEVGIGLYSETVNHGQAGTEIACAIADTGRRIEAVSGQHLHHLRTADCITAQGQGVQDPSKLKPVSEMPYYLTHAEAQEKDASASEAATEEDEDDIELPSASLFDNPRTESRRERADFQPTVSEHSLTSKRSTD